jgi:uncharacterized protein (DUF111 family)
MTIRSIGHGAGQRELLEQPNLLRVFVGDATDQANPAERDTVWVMETNLDDVPAEWIGYCQECLFAAGALDVYCIPIQMKKGRPGVLLSLIAAAERCDELEAILFRETGTFGVRRYPVQRHKLQRAALTVETPLGPIAGKRGWREGGPDVFTPEYEDCARVAQKKGIPLREVYAVVQRAYQEQNK